MMIHIYNYKQCYYLLKYKNIIFQKLYNSFNELISTVLSSVKYLKFHRLLKDYKD